MTRVLSAGLAGILLAGCLVCGPAEDYAWSLRAPSAVAHAPHSRLHFTVETSTPDGRSVDGAAYIWFVDWVGLRGVEHGGRSFREESILVKGAPGTAVLHILAHDRYDRLVEVARTSIQINGPQP